MDEKQYIKSEIWKCGRCEQPFNKLLTNDLYKTGLCPIKCPNPECYDIWCPKCGNPLWGDHDKCNKCEWECCGFCIDGRCKICHAALFGHTHDKKYNYHQLRVGLENSDRLKVIEVCDNCYTKIIRD